MGYIKGVRYCRVIDTNEQFSASGETDMDLVKVRISPEDDGISDSQIPWAFPLLPKMLHVKPKFGEGVFVILTELDNAMSQRYYIGPVISQDHRIFKDDYTYATSFMRGGAFKPDIAPSTKPEFNGLMPNDDDVILRGRKNADLQITNDDVRIKAGVKVVNETNRYEMHFNEQDPAYVKVKYHPGGLIQQKEYGIATGATRNENGTYRMEGSRGSKRSLKQGETEVMSTVTLVGDKINLIQNHSKEKEFVTTDRNDLITDDELYKALNEAYKLPYGEKLVEILSIFIDAFIKHTHPFMMKPPCEANGIPDLKDKKTEYLDNGKLLSDTVRIN